jgi:hypothetical protein
VWGDLARATEIAGLERPTEPGDSDAVVDYLMTLTGTRSEEGDAGTPVAVVPPDAAQVDRSADMADFVADVGWDILQVDRFVERQSRPDPITVLEGDFEPSALTTALGEPTDDVWVAGSGTPGEVDPEHITPARPLGESLWLSLAAGDGSMTITRSADDAAEADAAVGGDADGAVLGDDVSLAGLAAALDEQSAYGALLTRPGINSVAALGTSASPEQAEQLCDQLLPEPTAAVATGVADDDGPVILIALAHLSPDAARANADALEQAVTDGRSAMTGEAWSERLTLDGVETTGDDDLIVVARLRPVEPIGTRLWYDIVVRRDSLIATC